MKIVDFQTFCSLPPGTVFSFRENDSPIIEKWNIKGDSLQDASNGGTYRDFMYQSLPCVDARDGSEEHEMFVAAEKQGSDIPIGFDITERDGMFDYDRTFLVMDENEVNRLISRLRDTLLGL